MKNWQISPLPIKKIEKDRFSYNLISDLIKKKIDNFFKNNEIPSCICLNGDYGSGKSTIVNLLLNNSFAGCKNYRFVLFNSWRHQKEEIYYGLLRNLFYTLENKNKQDFRHGNLLEILDTEELKELDNKFSEKVYGSFSYVRTQNDKFIEGLQKATENLSKHIPEIFKHGLIELGIYVLIFLIFIIPFYLMSTSENFWAFYSPVFFVFASIVFHDLVKNKLKITDKILNFNIDIAKENYSYPKISNNEQLQILFREVISKKQEEEKVVIIIEDLDRKGSKEIVESLIYLRSFIDLGKVVFLIPCDIKNIEKAFKDDKTMEDTNSIWETGDFINKMFSHIIPIPPQNKQDLRLFLKTAVEEITNHPLLKLLDEKKVDREEFFNILIVDSLKTPREAINLFNKFTLKLEHALILEKKSNRVSEGTISNNILKYTRFFILAYYYSLEKYFIQNTEFINWILKGYNSRANFNEFKPEYLIPEDHFNFIKKIFKKNILTNELYRFISRTENYDSTELIKVFIHFDEYSYSGNSGNPEYVKIFEALRSKDKINVENYLNKSKESTSYVIDTIIDNIHHRIDENNTAETLIDLFDFIDEKVKKKVSNFIVDKFEFINKKTLYKFETTKIFDILKCSSGNKLKKGKEAYFDILKKLKLGDISEQEYIDNIKYFQIILESIQEEINTPKFIPRMYLLEIKSNFTLEIPDPSQEYEQISQIIKFLIKNNKKIMEVKKYFNIEVITRISKLYSELKRNGLEEESKNAIELLTNAYIQENDIEVVDSIGSLVKNDDTDEYYYDILLDIEIEFYSKVSKLKLLTNSLETIKKYLTLELYVINKDILKKAFVLFSKIDGNLWSIENIETDQYNNLLELYKENIQNTDLEFAKAQFKYINIYEKESMYPISDNLSSEISLKLKYAIENGIEELGEYLGEFLADKDRINNLETKEYDLYKIVMLNKVTYLTTTNAFATVVYNFISMIDKAVEGKKIIAEWIEDLVLSSNSILNFNYYLKTIDLLGDMVPKKSRINLLKLLEHNIINYRDNVEISIESWIWLKKLTEKYPEDNYKETMKKLFNSHAVLISSFLSKEKKYTVDFANLIDLYLTLETEQEFDNFSKILIISYESNKVLTLNLMKKYWGNFSMRTKKEFLVISSDEIVGLKFEIENETNLKDLIDSVYLEMKNIDLTNQIYNITKFKFDWEEYLKNNLFNIINKKDEDLIDLFLHLDIKFSEFNLNEDEIVNTLIPIFEDNNKFKSSAVKIMEKLDLKIDKKSDAFQTIEQNLLKEITEDSPDDLKAEMKTFLSKRGLFEYSNLSKKINL